MTSTLDDLREVLATRAATTPVDDAAARARFDARLTRRPTRGHRPLLVAAVAAVVLGVLAASVTAVLHRPDRTAPPAAGSALPLTDYLYDLDPSPLAAAGLTAWFGGVDATAQRAFVEPTGAAPNTAQSAVVLAGYDAAALGVATRPAGATDDTVDGSPGWTAPHTIAGDDLAYGIDGYLTTWTDSAGLTVRVVAADRGVLAAVVGAVRLGATHPVTFPAAFTPGALPTGVRLTAVEVDPDQGAQLTFAQPSAPDLTVTVDRPRVNVSAAATTQPLVDGFDLCVPRLRQVDLLTDGTRDLQVATGGGYAVPGDPVLPLATLRTLVGGMRFAPLDTPSAWFPVTTAVPTR